MLREAREETGFAGLSIARALGVRNGTWGGVDAEIFAYHMVFTERVLERWEHGEFSYDDPIRFEFFWVPGRRGARAPVATASLASCRN